MTRATATTGPGPQGPLILMVAPPGAGKSTLVAQWFPEATRFSLDQFRRILTGDVLDQSCSNAADLMLQVVVDYRLRTERLTVIDSTNATRERREALREKARARRRACVAVVLHTPLNVCIGRQKNRTIAPYAEANDRPVPIPVVERMYHKIHAEPPRTSEYDLVLHVHPTAPGIVHGVSRHGRDWATGFLAGHEGWKWAAGITLIESVTDLPWQTGPGYDHG